MELIIAREVIAVWNARNALEQKRILLPLDAEGARDDSASDLLIAFFCDSPGNPDDRTTSGSETEIGRQLHCGRPTLVYFSEAREDLIEARVLPAGALDEFKKRYAAAVVDSYADEKELRAKLARQLEATIGGHLHFKISGPVPPDVPAAIPPVPPTPSAATLSSCAQTILIEACDDFEAYIGRIKVGGMLRIQANGKQLVEQGDPAAVAKWESAFQQLLAGDLIRDAGCNGQLFQISTKGFDFLKSIGKTPVGYIAEMGGM